MWVEESDAPVAVLSRIAIYYIQHRNTISDKASGSVF
jgi:hypothetical protein